MKKTAAAVMAACMHLPVTAGAAHTQTDIQTMIDGAFTWLETNAQPLSSAGSSASDHYIMALSRMNRDYRYASYVDATSTITPSTPQDAQRLIMSNAACGEVLSNSFVGAYTYNAELSSASDIAGAITTLQSSGYDVISETTSLENMTGTLLTMQQSNGSFENDVTATAKSLIALSYSLGNEYILEGTADNEEYTYSVDSAVSAALTYLSGMQQADGGFSTMSASSYTVIALDSVGADAEIDERFLKNGVSVIDYIASHAAGDGSFSSSPDDTALAACALVSHLRHMQGKAPFYSFYSGDTVDAVTAESGAGAASTQAPAATAAPGSGTAATQAPVQSTPGTIKITPPPTRSPEHSAMENEEYGPQQFVGPVRQTDEPSGSAGSVSSSGTLIGVTAAIAAGVLILLLLAAAAVLYKVKPELFKKYKDKLRRIVPTGSGEEKTEAKPGAGTDLIDEIDKTHEVVPTEELYDPDFIKKLIPVDEIDSSIDSLLPKDDKNDTDTSADSGTADDAT